MGATRHTVPEESVGWRTVGGAIGIAVITAAAAQVLLRGLFLDLEVIDGRIASGVFHGIVIVVPVLLFLAWRTTAAREARVKRHLRASEVLREDLTSMLVHDLKSPVISAGIALGALAREGETRPWLNDEDREMLTIARESLARLEYMIGDILDIAKAEAGKIPLDLDLADLSDVVRQAGRHSTPQVEEAGVRLILEVAADAIPVHMDPDKIRRVLDNLLANAIKFTPSRGSIELRVSICEGEAVVTVRDTGVGIPEPLNGWIFEKFGRVEAGRGEGRSVSVGLGLYFCRLMVEAHGGRIWVAANPGGGSVFGFALPLVGPGSAQP